MNAKHICNVFNGILAVGLTLFASACSDDHFDVVEGTASSSKTIWQNLVEAPNVSDLRNILQKTPVMKSVTDNQSTITYAEFLDRPQLMTFWAPKDGTYDAQYYLDMLAGADTAATEAAKLEMRYRVGRQFVQNHLARFNFESNKALQEVNLMNSKVNDYDAGNRLFGNVPLVAEGSYPSSNGTLHLLDGYSPYYQSIYEFFKENYDSLSTILNSYDELTFSPGSSTPGAMNNQGNMEYVDSIYNRSNALLDYIGRNISDEDSLFIAFVPATDQAWNNMFNKAKEFYKYGDDYWYSWSQTNYEFINRTNATSLKFKTDSLQALNARSAIVRSLVSSATSFSGLTAKSDSAEVVSTVINADSIITTSHDVIFNPTPGSPNPLFEGKAPRKASNGYVFELDEFNFDPTYIWAEKREVTMDNDLNIARADNVEYNRITGTSWGETVRLDATNRNDSIYSEGTDVYRRFEVFGNNVTLSVQIKLRDVLSTKYRLKMVMAPNFTRISDIVTENDGITPVEVVSVFRVQVTDEKGNSIIGPIDQTVDQDSVKTYTVFDEVTFPKCYANLPDNADSWPILKIEMNNNYQKRKGKNNNALNIVKVILEPIHEGE